MKTVSRLLLKLLPVRIPLPAHAGYGFISLSAMRLRSHAAPSDL